MKVRDFNPHWFRVVMLSRKIVDKQEKVVCYTSGKSVEQVRKELQASNIGWIVKVKPITYDQMLEETA